MSSLATWGLAEGDAITAELTAVRRLGGGSGYEAHLAFDEVTYGPVVVKVVRPDQVADEHSLRGLAREVDALATVNHPVVVRGLRHELAGDRPHVVLEQVDGPRLSTLVRRYGRLPCTSTSRWRSRSPARCTTCAGSAGRTSTSSPAT